MPTGLTGRREEKGGEALVGRWLSQLFSPQDLHELTPLDAAGENSARRRGDIRHAHAPNLERTLSQGVLQ